MRRRTLVRTGSAALAAAVLGGAAGGMDSAWYRALEKPAFQPPPLAFPLVWTPLYIDLAVSSAVVVDGADAAGEEPAVFSRALGSNLVLNAAWTWLFFRLRAPRTATVECAVLAVSSADLVRRAARVDRRAGLALVPYAAWTAFATVLSAAIARRNPGVRR